MTVGEFRTKVVSNMEGSDSVRSTVPEAVAALLGAVPGATLLWSFEPGSAKVVVSVDRSVPVSVGPARSKPKKSSKRR
ncbi:MAG: hypothetical protein WCB18_04470 [Thermoplasmata archaeon]